MGLEHWEDGKVVRTDLVCRLHDGEAIAELRDILAQHRGPKRQLSPGAVELIREVRASGTCGIVMRREDYKKIRAAKELEECGLGRFREWYSFQSHAIELNSEGMAYELEPEPAKPELSAAARGLLYYARGIEMKQGLGKPILIARQGIQPEAAGELVHNGFASWVSSISRLAPAIHLTDLGRTCDLEPEKPELSAAARKLLRAAQETVKGKVILPLISDGVADLVREGLAYRANNMTDIGPSLILTDAGREYALDSLGEATSSGAVECDVPALPPGPRWGPGA